MITYALIIGLLTFRNAVSDDLRYDRYAKPWTELESIEFNQQLFDYLWPRGVEKLPESFKSRLDRTECTPKEKESCKTFTCKVNKLPWTSLSFDEQSPFENTAAFRCECLPGIPLLDYIDQQDDSKLKTSCMNKKECEKCHQGHTSKCIQTNTGFTCICHEEYLEDSHCHKRKDGCFELDKFSSMNGNDACLVKQGNKCFSIYHSMDYLCWCRYPYSEDKALSFPNCLKQESDCKKPLCLGFLPPKSDRIPGPSVVLGTSSDLESPMMSTCNSTLCQCTGAWKGPYCTERRGEPTMGSWSAWSSCNPDCLTPSGRWNFDLEQDSVHANTKSATGLGHMSRFSACSSTDSNYCVGTYRLWRRCRIRSLCSAMTSVRLTRVINVALEQAMIEHDKVSC